MILPLNLVVHHHFKKFLHIVYRDISLLATFYNFIYILICTKKYYFHFLYFCLNNIIIITIFYSVIYIVIFFCYNVNVFFPCSLFFVLFMVDSLYTIV